ncbi:hypothetical protein SKAU_G00265780 [Synaphobranchus kaupii]|uniref:Protein Jade-2 n=1 Tax=Synaphobranchus kaupii TaxID=118154 RepID=A0A9Q1EZK3_SYNKA|nr:hypothetical protein SKAU_G00265780 [Synaphobranchus kaupii]
MGFTELGQGDVRTPAEPLSQYDLDDLDVSWLELVNTEFRELALPEMDELTMERVLVELEKRCHDNMQLAIEKEEGLGIEYDEDVVCDVCRSPEGEDGNEMVFCDKCNVCVHQACYGILKVPLGNWLCRTCALGVQPKCLLCPKRGGALKPTRSGTKWVHVSCALWIPEVSIGCPEKMEPITKVSHIPASRWALSCSLCREHTGTCIQCSMPSCIVAFHVTCAFDHSLEMRTILAENDEVRFKSYCLEHSSAPQGSSKAEQRAEQAGPEQPPPPPDQTEREKASRRKQKLQEMEDEFYLLVNPKDVAEGLGLPDAHVDFLYQYWKLRRKSNFNQPLVALKRDEVDNLAQQEQDVLYRRLKLFTHLRQDLERVRNLCYMVTRRGEDEELPVRPPGEDLPPPNPAPPGGPSGRKAPEGGERTTERSEGEGERAAEKQPGEEGEVEVGERVTAQTAGFLQDLPSGRDAVRRLAGAVGADHGGRHAEPVVAGQGAPRQDGQPAVGPAAAGKTRGKPRPRGYKPLPNSASTAAAAAISGARGNKGVAAEKGGAAARRAERSRSAKAPHHLHLHHQLHPQTRADEAERDPPQPPISKMDSCHISEEHEPWDGHTAPPAEPSCPVTVPKAGGGARSTLRLRLSRQGKSRSKVGGQDTERDGAGKDSSLFDTETDGYFSDAEQSDSDTRSSGRKLGLGQLHAGKEDVLRRSVMAS